MMAKLNTFSRGRALVFTLVFVFTPLARGQAPRPVHGSVELISEESAIHPGQQISVGLHFKIEDGWHTYWVNPGDSGQPAFVRWQLPQGWQPGPTLWPAPERIPDHSMVDYGYESGVLLIVPIRAPANLTIGRTVDLRASVEWLVCRDVCVPAQAAVNLPLPVIKGTRVAYSRWHDLFQKARATLPGPAPRSWKVEAGLEGSHFIVQIDAGHPEKAIGFFPLDPNQIENTIAPVISPYGRGVRVILTKSDQLISPISRFKGVLVMAPERAYTFDAPVVPIRSNQGK
ncbi:MAG: protein-disulfide reductase DsbD domain-containing protein [Terriglobia bacterium]